MDPMPPPDDPVEALLAGCLTAADPEAALAAAAAAHPNHARDLRAAFALLCRAGLTDPPRSGRPERLGRFRLLRELGGGGMGMVHLAEEEPLGRHVALKRVRPELLHFPGARQRFLREIAAIASLQHPGIVPIYSYGEEDGVPYYAMELVAGRSLAEVVLERRGAPRGDASALRQPTGDWTDACFRIASQLAEALTHAHDRGIVHRDVKPSNAMLADDGRALLIDFGLARQAGDDSLTKSGVQPGSLAYMSPEQVRGEPVDARTDIWSLGVVLYELLTLQSPFAAATEEQTRQNILRGVAADVRRSGSGVPWDAAIVLGTAMAPERERRYATMREFADDLRAFVEHRPIRARRASALLRLRRYAQRRPALATGLVLSALLVVSLPTTLYLTERAARAAVQREADTARAAVAFLEDLFAECEPQRARGATVPARAILDRGVQRVRGELRDQPGIQAALLEAMGSAYLKLGLFQDSTPLLAEARRLRETAASSPADLDRVLQLQAHLASARGDDAEAEALWRRIRAGQPPMSGPHGVRAAETNLQLAYALWRQDRIEEAADLTITAVAALRRLLPADDVRIGRALLAHGVFLQERDDPAHAAPLLREGERILTTALPQDHPDVIAANCDVARNARVLGELPLAAEKLASAEQAAHKLFDRQHPQLAMVHEELASLSLALDQPQRASEQLGEALAAYRAIHPAPNHVLARALNLQSTIAIDLGDLPAAETAAREALAMYEQIYPKGHLDMAAALCNLAMVHNEVGNPPEAIRLARESLAMQDRIGQRHVATRAMTTAHLGYALAFEGDNEQALLLARQAVAMVQQTRVEPAVEFRVRCLLCEVLCIQRHASEAVAAADALLADHANAVPSWRGWATYLLGWALEVQRELPRAEQVLREALELRRQSHGATHPMYGIVLQELGVVLSLARRPQEAEPLLAEAVAIRRRHGGPNDVHLNLPLLNLATVHMFLRRHDEAVAEARECLANLRGKVKRGHPIAQGVVVLLTRLWGPLQPPAARASLLPQLRELEQFAREVLLPDDPAAVALAKAIEAAGG